MQKKWLIILIAAGVMLGGLALIFYGQDKSQKIELSPSAEIHSAYSQITELYGNLDVEPQAGPAQKIGGISSHHFFVSNKIASFIAGLKSAGLATIVILGPNHFGAGSHDILISRFAYKTPWGTLENDKNIGDRLINSGLAFNEETPFEREHSISALAGFIKYYIPDVKIVPVIIKLGVKAPKADELARILNEILPQNSFVLASVDFSHHTTFSQANEWDKKTAEVLKDFNFNQIYNCQMDSHASIYALLKYLEMRGAKDISYFNLNSAQLMNNLDFQDVTSYFFAYFGKNN